MKGSKYDCEETFKCCNRFSFNIAHRALFLYVREYCFGTKDIEITDGICLARVFVFSDNVSYLLIGKVYRITFWILLAFYLASSFVVSYNDQVNKFSIMILAVYLVVIVIVDIKNYDFNAKWFIYIKATYGLEDRCSLTESYFRDCKGNRDKEEVNFKLSCFRSRWAYALFL